MTLKLNEQQQLILLGVMTCLVILGICFGYTLGFEEGVTQATSLAQEVDLSEFLFNFS